MAKMTKKGQSFVSSEISRMMKKGPSSGPQKGKKMPQKQAIAVALSVARRKGFKTAPYKKDEATSIFDRIITEKELTTRGRKQIDPENFAVPEKAPGPGSYPIHDLAHARNALARVSTFGSPAEKAKVEKAVYKKYPALKSRKLEREGKDESTGSLFDGLVESTNKKSIFDNIVYTADDDWDNKAAQTLTLAEELINLRKKAKSSLKH